ncbi:hypothetical protein GIB67_041776 [Kingdonia uniflora]|uniref:Condensin complex subunit 1 C-terminal domain-containing protein n=1 Tax=Kingdonia uniflora TaxID=39325 RepID=A0A7J7N436_9MAGN|nr:hypothetical protein GIB67_041776 [Kingdonia uniflora]
MDDSLTYIITDIETLETLPLQTLTDLQTLFETAIDSNSTDELDDFYEELSSKNISTTHLIRTITTTMDSTPTRQSLLASQLYLSILLSPNAPVFSLFTPISFLSLLSSLRRSFKHRDGGGDSGGGVSRRDNRRKRGGGGGGGGRGKGYRGNVEEETGGDGERFDVRALYPLLERLELVLGKIHLDRFPDSLKSLIHTVAEIPITALECYENSSSYKTLSDLCFRILSAVLSPEHGDQTNVSVEILKSLSPAILLLKSQARTCALTFVTKKMMGVAKESGAVRKAIVYLPRYLVNKAPEKSEPRACAAESIMEIVRAMEKEDQVEFAKYVVKLTNGKARMRLLAVDLIPMLFMSLPDPLGLDVLWGVRCLEALIQRCSDSAAGIRARALSNLAQVLGFLMGNFDIRDRLKEVVGVGNSRSSKLNDLLRQRCVDEKAVVRKAALLLITKSTALLDGDVDEAILKTMGVACSDPLVSIRKAAISAFSEVCRKSANEHVITEWLHSIPCLITDNESSIQEECENLFLELVLDRVSRVGSPDSNHNVRAKSQENDSELDFPQGILALLKEICDGAVTPCVKKICMSLGKKKRLKPAIAIALQNIIKTSECHWLRCSMPIQKWTAPPGAWLLLSEISTFLPKAVDWEFLHHHWKLLEKTDLDSEIRSPIEQGYKDKEAEGVKSAAWAGDRVFVLQTISNVSTELPPEPAADLAHNLLKRIEEFNMHSTEVNAHVKTLRTLCKRKALDPKEGDALVLRWVNQLFSKALRILEAYISEASQPRKASVFLTPPRSTGPVKGKREETEAKLLFEAVTAVYTVGSLVLVSPSADLKGIIPVLHTIITSGNTESKLKKLPGSAVHVKQMAPSLYIQSWLTMGKICLADGNLAKRYIPLFVQELENNEYASLRNNIVLMMADFCVRYTALIDCYIPNITNCLRDPCEVVRRQTFILLSRLLQRDYVKWRGVLFLRFLLCLVDDSAKIRQLADFLFGSILKAKAPLLAYNSFVEAIFVLNGCHAHAGHSESQEPLNQSRLFSIRGNDEKSRSQRMHIYISLLKQMAPEHLLATSAKLCAEILAATSDGLLNLDDVTGQSVLQDALQILASKEIRIQSNRGSAGDTTEMDEDGGDDAAAARRKVVAQVAKKSLIQNAIPIFIELKRLLESKNSPLTGKIQEHKFHIVLSL